MDTLSLLMEYTNQVLRLLGIASDITFSGGLNPYIESHVTDKEVVIFCELQGIDSDKIQVDVGRTYIRISVKNLFSRLTNTPALNPLETHIRYNNNVLETRITRIY